MWTGFYFLTAFPCVFKYEKIYFQSGLMIFQTQSGGFSFAFRWQRSWPAAWRRPESLKPRWFDTFPGMYTGLLQRSYHHKYILTTCKPLRVITANSEVLDFWGMQQFVIKNVIWSLFALHKHKQACGDEGGLQRGNFPFCCVTISCFLQSDNRGERRRRL